MTRSFLLLTTLLAITACDEDTKDTSTIEATDADGDGYAEADDCDDSDSSINPDAAELCDGIDNNCDGTADEGVLLTFYADADGDGFGDAEAAIEACAASASEVEDATDCDDADGAVNPSAAEVCDSIDNNCDGATDEGVLLTFYADADGDGFGDVEAAVEACEPGEGEVEDATDCDDADVAVNPGSAELCDGIDNDCDAATTEAGLATFFDADGVWSDRSDTLSGAVTLDEAGTLEVCAGSWDVNLTITAPVTIRGAGSAETTLDGGERNSVIFAQSDVVLEGLQLTGGVSANVNEYGSSVRWKAGGGIYCLGEHSVTGSDLVITGNSAEIGGGVLSDGCAVSLTDAEVSNNSAEYGGGINITEGDLSIVDSLLADNSASTSGGGIYSSRPEGATITLDGSTIEGNTASYGGGIILVNDALMTCTDSDIIANEASTGGGLYVGGDSSFSAKSCGFGVSGSADENSSVDVETKNSSEGYMYGDSASFVCDSAGCE